MIEISGGRIRRRDKRIWFVMLGVFAAVFLFTFLSGYFKTNDEEVNAASLANFDPGYIISDWQMGNYTSMSEADIQNFLTSKNSCPNRDYNYYLRLSANTNYKWHWDNGHFICLSEERFGDGEVIGSGDTAAHIIWQAAQDYKINPKVLIVLLQKETSLITDPIPNNGDYRKATGYGCPDTAPCSSQYYGFKNQIRKAAALFRTVLDGGWTNYPLGNNYVQYNPNPDCGGSVVNIRSLATSALYRYTPYQPNAGAIAAGYGTAPCGAYGNRNFYHYFQDWFGGITSVGWDSMMIPRVMTVNNSTMLIDTEKNETTGYWLNKGENYYFTKKISIFWNGEQQICLQREVDNGTNSCALMPRLLDYSYNNGGVSFDEVQKYEVKQWTCEVDLLTREARCDRKSYSVGAILNIVGSVTIDNKEYLIEEGNNGMTGVLELRTKRKYGYDTIGPKVMRLKENSYKFQAGTDVKTQVLTIGDYPYIKILDRITINGKEYYRTAHDAERGIEYVIPKEALTEDIFDDFKHPRNLTIKNEINSFDIDTNIECKKYNAGETNRYLFKLQYAGEWYYQNEDEKNTRCVIPSKNLEEAYYSFDEPNALSEFIDFLYPRNLMAGESFYLINTTNGTTCDKRINRGDIQKYTTKIIIFSETFYRSETDTAIGSYCAVPARKMLEL